MSIIILPMVGMSGEFKCILRNPDGSIADERDWSSNLILDSGLIAYGGFPVFSYCSVGSDNTAADVSQTGLLDRISTVQIDSSGSSVFSGANDYTQSMIATYQFGPSASAWNVQEMGTGGVNDGTQMYCRHVVSPPINKSEAQSLDVYYRHTKWPPLGDTLSDVTFDGQLFHLTIRAAALAWTTVNYALSAPASTSGGSGGDGHRVYDGNIGANTTLPSGNSTTSSGTHANVAYSAPNLYRDSTNNAGLTQANLAGDILRSLLVEFNSFRCQIQFAKDGEDPGDPAFGLPKSPSEIWGVTIRQSWGRKV